MAEHKPTDRFVWQKGEINFLPPAEAAKMKVIKPPPPKKPDHPHITGQEKI